MGNKTSDPLKPSLQLLMKLGSIVVHFDEFVSTNGHSFDIEAARALVVGADVQQWIKDMGILLPKKR